MPLSTYHGATTITLPSLLASTSSLDARSVEMMALCSRIRILPVPLLSELKVRVNRLPDPLAPAAVQEELVARIAEEAKV